MEIRLKNSVSTAFFWPTSSLTKTSEVSRWQKSNWQLGGEELVSMDAGQMASAESAQRGAKRGEEWLKEKGDA